MPERTPPLGKEILSDVSFCSWFSGLVDGEGCFYIGRNGCSFLMTLRADDIALLELLQEQFGIGSIRFTKVNRPGGHKPTAVWTVARRAHCRYLVEVFDAYPLKSKKARDYGIWREALFVHKEQTSAALVAPYRAALAEVRKYVEPGELMEQHPLGLPNPNVQQSLIGGLS